MARAAAAEVHPHAYLRQIRNVAQGLSTRSKILRAIEGGASTLAEIRGTAGVSGSVADHHLGLLRRESILRSLRTRPRRWVKTGLGQTSLVEKSGPTSRLP